MQADSEVADRKTVGDAAVLDQPAASVGAMNSGRAPTGAYWQLIWATASLLV
jgi:hypothetical protein